MTDWSRLKHAYGSADDVPALLDRLVPDPGDDVWEELWSRLCHQLTVYTASFAALPRLAETAGRWAPADRMMILSLCGSIVAGAQQRHRAADMRAAYAAETAELLRLTGETMRVPTDERTFVYLLQAEMAFENVPVWDETLDRLADGEYELDGCPGCGTGLFVSLGEYGRFVTSGDYAIEDDVPKGDLSPADPARLDQVARRIHDTAQQHGQPELAAKLLHLFGDAACPDCGAVFSVAGQIVQEMNDSWSGPAWEVPETWRFDGGAVAVEPDAVIEELRARIARGRLESWLTSSSGLWLAVVTNRARAVVMLLDGEGDPGEHAVDLGADGVSDGFVLSNGQWDEYPDADTVPLQEAFRIVRHIVGHGTPPEDAPWATDR